MASVRIDVLDAGSKMLRGQTWPYFPAVVAVSPGMHRVLQDPRMQTDSLGHRTENCTSSLPEKFVVDETAVAETGSE